MLRLRTDLITDTKRFPIKKGTLEFLQDAYKDCFTNLLIGLIGPSYSGLNVYIIYGATNSGSGSAYNISAGAAFYLGEIFPVANTSFTASGGQTAVLNITTTQYTTNADPVTFSDATINNIHDNRFITVASGVSGSGIKNYANVIFLDLSKEELEERLQDQIDSINSAWFSSAPTLSSSAFVASTNNVTFRWKIIGKTVHCRFFYNVVTTGSGDVELYWDMTTLSTPITALAPQCSASLQVIESTNYLSGGYACRIGNGTDFGKMCHVIPDISGIVTLNVTGTITFEMA